MRSATPRSPAERSPGRAALVVLLLAAAALRLAGLGANELWLDEAETANQAVLPLAALMDTFPHDNKPPLYYLALHVWTRVAGDSEAALRLPSALAGVLMTLLLLHLGRRLAGDRAGFAAAWFAALSPLAIHYSQAARNHAPTATAVLLALCALERAISSGKVRDWSLYAAAAAAALLIQYSAASALAAGALLLLATDRPVIRAYLLASAAAVASLAPWTGLILRQTEIASSTVSWLEPFWKAYPPALAVPLSLRAFAPGGDVPAFVALSTPAVGQWALGFGACLMPLLVVLPSRKGWLNELSSRSVLLPLGLTFVPLLTQWLVSFKTPIYMVGRTDFVAFPGFCLLVGVAYQRLASKGIRVLGAGLFFLAAGAGLRATWSAPPLLGQRAAMERLSAELREGDLLIFTGLSRPPAEYYLRQAMPTRTLRLRSFPSAMSLNPATFDPARFDGRREELAADGRRLVAEIDGLPAGNQALIFWVDDPLHVLLLDALSPRYKVMPHGQLPSFRLSHLGTRVEVLSLRPRP